MPSFLQFTVEDIYLSKLSLSCFACLTIFSFHVSNSWKLFSLCFKGDNLFDSIVCTALSSCMSTIYSKFQSGNCVFFCKNWLFSFWKRNCWTVCNLCTFYLPQRYQVIINICVVVHGSFCCIIVVLKCCFLPFHSTTIYKYLQSYCID